MGRSGRGNGRDVRRTLGTRFTLKRLGRVSRPEGTATPHYGAVVGRQGLGANERPAPQRYRGGSPPLNRRRP